MLLEGGIPGNGQPTTIGHEGVGCVDKVGKNVQGYKYGDRIGFLYIKGCCCKYSLNGRITDNFSLH
jgi:D-arabinose 1-dehydrogenase-like Zn-dependent alcohol dehydrogenase